MNSPYRNFSQTFCLLVYLFLGLNSQVQSNNISKNILVLTDEHNIYSIAQYISVLEDPTNLLKLKDIQNIGESWQFKKNAKDNLSIGYSESTYWLKFKIKNTSKMNKPWLIQHNYANTHKMNIYIEGNNFKPQKSGSIIPVTQREFLQKEIVFSTAFPSNKEQYIYIDSSNAVKI